MQLSLEAGAAVGRGALTHSCMAWPYDFESDLLEFRLKKLKHAHMYHRAFDSLYVCFPSFSRDALGGAMLIQQAARQGSESPVIKRICCNMESKSFVHICCASCPILQACCFGDEQTGRAPGLQTGQEATRATVTLSSVSSGRKWFQEFGAFSWVSSPSWGNYDELMNHVIRCHK